jgi:hypothetical protein
MQLRGEEKEVVIRSMLNTKTNKKIIFMFGVGLRGNVGDARYFLRLCGCAIAKDARSVNSYALPRRMGGLQVGYVHLMLVGPP